MDKNQEDQIVNQLSGSINPVVTDIQTLVHDVVVLVEAYEQSVAPLNSADKEQIAVDVANGMVKLPFPFSMFQKLALKLLVKYAVSKLNDAHGHAWPQVQPSTPTVSTSVTGTSSTMALPPKPVEPESTDSPTDNWNED